MNSYHSFFAKYILSCVRRPKSAHIISGLVYPRLHIIVTRHIYACIQISSITANIPIALTVCYTCMFVSLLLLQEATMIPFPISHHLNNILSFVFKPTKLDNFTYIHSILPASPQNVLNLGFQFNVLIYGTEHSSIQRITNNFLKTKLYRLAF